MCRKILKSPPSGSCELVTMEMPTIDLLPTGSVPIHPTFLQYVIFRFSFMLIHYFTHTMTLNLIALWKISQVRFYSVPMNVAEFVAAGVLTLIQNEISEEFVVARALMIPSRVENAAVNLPWWKIWRRVILCQLCDPSLRHRAVNRSRSFSSLDLVSISSVIKLSDYKQR